MKKKEDKMPDMFILKKRRGGITMAVKRELIKPESEDTQRSINPESSDI